MSKLKIIAKNSRLYYLSAVLFLLPAYLVRFSILGIPTTLLEILIYLGIIWSLFNLKDWKKLSQIPRLIWLGIGLFVLSAVMGTLISPNKTTALGQLKGFIIDPLLLMALIYIWLAGKEKISYLYQSLIASGVVVGLIAIYQRLAEITTFDNRVLSVWQYDPGASPNYLSLYLAPIAVLAFIQLISCTRLSLRQPANLKITLRTSKSPAPDEHRRCQDLQNPRGENAGRASRRLSAMLSAGKLKSILYGMVGLTVILAGLYLSGSRGGLLAFAAGVGYFTLKTLWQTRPPWLSKTGRLPTDRWLTVGLILIIVTGIFLAGRPDLSVGPDSGRISSSNNIRWQIWQVTVQEIIPQRWLTGVGLGNFQNHFTQLTQDRVNFPEFISPRALTPHNLFLTLWVNGGIMMLGSLSLILYLLYTNPSKDLIIEKTLMLSIIVYGLIDTPFLKNDLSILVWLIFTAYVIKTIPKQVAD
jgi:hypothetical protein